MKVKNLAKRNGGHFSNLAKEIAAVVSRDCSRQSGRLLKHSFILFHSVNPGDDSMMPETAFEKAGFPGCAAAAEWKRCDERR